MALLLAAPASTALQASSQGSLDSASTAIDPAISALEASLKFVFSWVILTPIAIIVAGKMLAQRMKFAAGSAQLFKITLAGVINVEARNDEVILGFTGFLITLLAVGVLGGVQTYVSFKAHFGIDPGQFNALCIVSGMLLVLWTFTLFLVLIPFRRAEGSALAAEHSERIEQLTNRPRV